MEVDAPCPECGHTPVDVLNMLDGSVWICPKCGHREYGEVCEEPIEDSKAMPRENNE